MPENGILRAKLEEACSAAGYARQDLTVQSNASDPYRLDTRTGRCLAAWFAEQINRLVPSGDVHLRALHYKMLGRTSKPDGQPYLNTDADWTWMQQAASCARWLHAVPFDRIADGRNDDPEIFALN